MDKDEILNMRAGRGMDALIDTLIFDCKYHMYLADNDLRRISEDLRGPAFYPEVPHYSTNIAAAWQVKKKMQDDGWALTLECPVKANPLATFTKQNKSVYASGKDESEAMSKAALLAVMEKG